MKKKIWLVFLAMVLVFSACGPGKGKITAGQEPVSVAPEDLSLSSEANDPRSASKESKVPEEVLPEERPLTQEEKDRLKLFVKDLEGFPFSSAGSSLRAAQLFAQLENDFIFYPQCKLGVDQYILEEYKKLQDPENYDKTMNILIEMRKKYREKPEEIEALAADAGVKIQPVLQEKMQDELFKALNVKKN